MRNGGWKDLSAQIFEENIPPEMLLWYQLALEKFKEKVEGHNQHTFGCRSS